MNRKRKYYPCTRSCDQFVKVSESLPVGAQQLFVSSLNSDRQSPVSLRADSGGSVSLRADSGGLKL